MAQQTSRHRTRPKEAQTRRSPSSRRTRLAARLGALALMAVGITVGVLAETSDYVPAPADVAVSARADAAPAVEAAALTVTTTSTTSTTLPASESPKGTGEFTIAPGSGAQLGSGSLQRFRVEVEDGIDVDPASFASDVESVLGDDRSWTGSGGLSLQRTDGGSYDFKVVLASPDTVDSLCSPLHTNGILSCNQGNKAILNHWRWLAGDDDFGSDVEGYRAYLVNHEVGHALGHDHVDCGGEGEPAPVMMQQTKSVGACEPNSWPLESER